MIMALGYDCYCRVKEVAKQERGNKKYFSSFSQDDDSDEEELTAEQKGEWY